MTLRTKLIIAFLLMSVLPLSGIVLFSYLTSLRAFERAVEAESREMTEQIGHRMDRLKREARQRIERDWSAPFLEMARQKGAEVPHERVLEILEREVAAAVPWLDSLEWEPSQPAAAPPAPPPPVADVGVVGEVEETVIVANGDGTSASEFAVVGLPEGVDTPWVIQIEREEPGSEAVKAGVKLSLMHPRLPEHRTPGHDGERAREDLESEAEHLSARLDHLSEKMARAQERSEARAAELAQGGGDLHAAIDDAVAMSSLAAEITRLELEREKVNRLLGADFSSEVAVGGRVLGHVRAQVSPSSFLREVLASTESPRGEVPFALDPEGNLYTQRPEQRERLDLIQETLEECAWGEDDRQVAVGGDWMVVTERDPDSSLVFGIARPVAESLAEMRNTAMRNFGMGVGLVGLALLGILPLSSRMTRRINHLTERAERLASGDLAVRADVHSSDEIGQLGRAFNRMAEDLTTHQEKLLEQQLQQRLLESEHERKSSELEEARRFQLSLLPRELPRTAKFELAVFMKTATEVGGDYYDFHVDERGALTIAIGDATGHGAAAGTMVTAIKSLFSARASDRGPRLFLEEASRAVKSMRLDRMSMALAMASFEPLTDGQVRLTVSSAGMPPLLLHRAECGSLDELVLEGLPLGAMEEASYEERTALLAAGDCVLLMSDGLPELVSPSGEVYGYGQVHDQLRRLSRSGPQATLDALAAEVDRWTCGERPADDVTFVALRCLS